MIWMYELWFHGFCLGLSANQHSTVFWGNVGKAEICVHGFSAASTVICKAWICCAPLPCPCEISLICCKKRLSTSFHMFGEGRFQELTTAVSRLLFYWWCSIQNNTLDIQLKWEKLLFFSPLSHQSPYLLQFACYLYFLQFSVSDLFTLFPLAHLQAEVRCSILSLESSWFRYKKQIDCNFQGESTATNSIGYLRHLPHQWTDCICSATVNSIHFNGSTCNLFICI